MGGRDKKGVDRGEDRLLRVLIPKNNRGPAPLISVLLRHLESFSQRRFPSTAVEKIGTKKFKLQGASETLVLIVKYSSIILLSISISHKNKLKLDTHLSSLYHHTRNTLFPQQPWSYPG
jgi:hypothetical protein